MDGLAEFPGNSNGLAIGQNPISSRDQGSNRHGKALLPAHDLAAHLRCDGPKSLCQEGSGRA
jgi:hypothetical protein